MPSQSYCVFCQKHWDIPRVRFFHIPKDAERRNAWSNICGLELNECLKICEQHFNRKDFVFSRTYKRYRLLKDAMPVKELINIVPEHGAHNNELEDDYNHCSQKKRKVNGTKGLKDAETQTRHDNQMISCGSLQVTKDYRIFTIKCDFCRANFTLWNYASYMQHIKAKHRHYEEENCAENQEIFVQNAYTSAGDINVEDYVVGDNIEIDYEEEYIEYDPSGDEQNVTIDENSAEMERLKEILAKNNVVVKKFGQVSEVVEEEEHVLEEVIDVGDSEVDNMKAEGIIVEKRQPQDMIDEINIYTTDELLVWPFIEMLKTYPILWHPPPLKLPENYLLTLLAFCKVFNEQYQLGMTNAGMRNSIENLQKWYQENYNNWESLAYPQNEYFHKCATFLSDRPDGTKTCEICQHEALDYLQYVLHKKNSHEIPLSDSCLPNNQVEMYLRTRWYRVLNLECQLCSHKYKYINAFVIHMKAHADVREFVCDLCGAAFVRLEGLNVHRRRHTGPIQRICKICNKSFNDFQLLGMHRRRYHRPIEGTIEEIEENLKTRRRTMNKRTVQSTKYTTRLDPKTNKRFYICHFCHKEYHQYSGLHKHFRLWHKSEWVPTGRVGRPKADAQPVSKTEPEEDDEEGEYVEEYTEEYTMNADEIEVEHIYAEVDEEETEADECEVEFDFDMEPAEEIEIQ